MEKSFNDQFSEPKQRTKSMPGLDAMEFLVRTPPEKHIFQTPKINMVLSQCISSNLARFDVLDSSQKHLAEEGDYSGIETVTQGKTDFSISPMQDLGSLFDTQIRKILENPNFLNAENEVSEVKEANDDLRKPSPNDKELDDDFSMKTGRYRRSGLDNPPTDSKCNCKNSQCVKLYCKCFRMQNYCKDCSCSGCQNLTDNSIRRSAMKSLQNKNLLAFPTPFSSLSPSINYLNNKAIISPMNTLDVKPLVITTRGCNCVNSRCQKRYCECFLNGLSCGDRCKCCNCLNNEKDKDVVSSEEKISNEQAIKKDLISRLQAIKRIKFKVGE